MGNNNIRDLENKIWYNRLLMKSLESKAERAEPFSDEFEETTQNLFRLKEEQTVLSRQLAEASWNASNQRS